ncbi:hypothetical protein BC567DRAFT_232498 [Phyllosticta citribraziliensis]
MKRVEDPSREAWVREPWKCHAGSPNRPHHRISSTFAILPLRPIQRCRHSHMSVTEQTLRHGHVPIWNQVNNHQRLPTTCPTKNSHRSYKKPPDAPNLVSRRSSTARFDQ